MKLWLSNNTGLLLTDDPYMVLRSVKLNCCWLKYIILQYHTRETTDIQTHVHVEYLQYTQNSNREKLYTIIHSLYSHLHKQKLSVGFVIRAIGCYVIIAQVIFHFAWFFLPWLIHKIPIPLYTVGLFVPTYVVESTVHISRFDSPSLY